MVLLARIESYIFYPPLIDESVASEFEFDVVPRI